MLTTAVMAGFGFFFWLISAKLFSTTDIGMATTLISVMGLTATLSLVGINASFVRFLPTAKDRNSQMNTGLLLVAIAATILSLLFVAVVAFVSPQLAFIQHDPWLLVAFICACVMTAINTLTDSVFLSGRQAVYTFVITAIFSLFKMLAPLAFIGWGATGIFAAAALAQTLGTVLSIAAMMKWFGYRPSLIINIKFLAETWRYSAANYLAGILNLLPVTLLPIIIINHLGAASAAYYYIAFMIANLMYAIPYATTRSLFAEGSHDEVSLHTNVKKSVRIIALLLVPAVVILFFGSGFILRVFGQAYVSGAADFLRIMALAGISVSAYSLFGALLQVKKDSAGLIIMNVVYAASTILLSYTFLGYGLAGVGIAWVCGNTIATVTAYIMYTHTNRVRMRLARLQSGLWFRFFLGQSYVRALWRNRFSRKVILCYPDMPERYHMLYIICQVLGYRITTDRCVTHDVVIYFADTTTRAADATLSELRERGTVINGYCTDISKERVEDVFSRVFGYGMRVDPQTHVGPCVRKSNTNALHDGKIIQCPTTPEPGFIYQKVINNTIGENVYDIRVIISKHSIPVVAYRFRNVHDHFDNTRGMTMGSATDYLSPDEMRKVFEFCDMIGLQYGELDILRDGDDGRMYIVDANNTPGTPEPGKQLTRGEYRRFVSLLANSFESVFLAGEKR